MSDQERIDLQKLTQKELLIVTYQKVTELSEVVTKIREKQEKHEVRISVVESRVMMWGALFGAIASTIITVIVSLLK